MGNPDWRINGKPYTCENARFHTVSGETITQNDDGELRLEQLGDQHGAHPAYWLIWYDPSGNPSMRGSAVFGKQDVPKIIGQLAKILDDKNG